MSKPPNDFLDPNDVAVGKRIAEALLIKGVSINSLANDTGISRSSLTRSINGIRPFNMREFLRISAALNLAPHALIPDIEAA